MEDPAYVKGTILKIVASSIIIIGSYVGDREQQSCFCNVFILGLFDETWRFYVAQGIKLQICGALFCSVSCWFRFCEMSVVVRVV
jgi:hypothetical protein